MYYKQISENPIKSPVKGIKNQHSREYLTIQINIIIKYILCLISDMSALEIFTLLYHTNPISETAGWNQTATTDQTIEFI